MSSPSGDPICGANYAQAYGENAPPSIASTVPVGDNSSPTGSYRKRKRRILSCDTCRRLKCRCDYDDSAGACHRCRTLRVECSLGVKSQQAAGNASTGTNVTTPTSVQGIENRLCSLEKSIQDIKDVLLNIHTPLQQNLVHETNQHDGTNTLYSIGTPNVSDTPTNTQVDHTHEHDGEPHLAPATVMRRLCIQLNGGQRRNLQNTQDLVQLGIVTDESADMLIMSFVHHYRYNQFVNDLRGVIPNNSVDLRKASPLLHSVCCLYGMVSNQDFAGTAAHRQVYEEVRRKLGQVLLTSPLPREELIAVNAISLFASAPTAGPEYIDSWMLSGQCAQQALLSVDFAGVRANVQNGDASQNDQIDLRIWAGICLTHLQWAAATGRPPFIPRPYIDYCLLLIDIYQASIEDAMVVAEINLYACVSVAGDRQELSPSVDMESWTQKWSHLFRMPQSTCLKLGYHVAVLILAKRTLGRWRSEKGAGHSTDSHQPGNRGTDMELIEEGGNTGHQQRGDAAPTPSSVQPQSLASLELDIANAAIQVLKTTSRLADHQVQALPVFYSLCIAYSILTISHYNHSSPEFPDALLLRLLMRLKELKCDNGMSGMGFAIDRAISNMTIRSQMSQETSSSLQMDCISTGSESRLGNEQPPVTDGDFDESGHTRSAASDIPEWGPYSHQESGQHDFADMLDSFEVFFSGGFTELMRHVE